MPVLDRREPLSLVARELDVDLGGGNDADFGHLDDRPRRPRGVLDSEPVAWARGLLLAVQAGGGGLLAVEDGLDELLPQLGAGIAEAELR